jgi:hypothetical protein
MSGSQYKSVLLLTSLRWFARFWGLVLAGLVLALAVGEGFNPARLRSKELLLAVPFFIAWMGLLLGWRWEGVGGLLVLTGIVGFCLVHFMLVRRFPGWAFPVIAVPGALYLVSWYFRRRAATGSIQV